MKSYRPKAWNESTAWAGLAGRYRDDLLIPLGLRPLDINVVVEIGVDFGFSLTNFAIDFPHATVFGVDEWAGDDTQALERKQQIVSEDSHALGNIRILKMESGEARKLWDDPTFFVHIDLLHIDADHQYASVRRDFELWSPLVRSGGVVLFHDTESFPDDVGRFYREICDGHDPEGHADLKFSSGLGAWRKP